uniref:S-adenosyl-L-methionine-dependent tRNA 4-demethylwyosine synthase TYW1 n=1 Tax=Aceria tosichella TaxID=561515 RepID=A0A6G1SCN2_9ACAR
MMAQSISEARIPNDSLGNLNQYKVLDIEDMGKLSQFTKEQLSDRLRGDLSRQGYKLVGSHSAVKMCRWTKNSMRGRGGCYKHTFYGIKSYQCMEMTPNLACASKCTFCWRHHKNPTATEWKWKMDAPDEIVAASLENHHKMIKSLRGVPGVTEERYQEAHTVRHCALSLVGEPIFYPRINELLGMLHERGISTFLVTNAQFPEAMRTLVPVTQLYVSIDAPNKETLKKIDRPLYRDFWERYIECLEIIREKKQRTVFRLTLVQKANMSDLEGYSELIKIGLPDFIEIKGVTYCGTSKANTLTMENVPWHEQVVEFAQDLLPYLPKDTYELACEHSHSNCVLIANKKFKINNKWHTWIDYEKYFELINLMGSQVNHQSTFTSLDYAAPSPSWAIFGSEESGFDPEHRRWIRKDHKLTLLKERLAAQGNTPSSDDEIFFDAND